jgi:hypothetical protein
MMNAAPPPDLGRVAKEPRLLIDLLGLGLTLGFADVDADELEARAYAGPLPLLSFAGFR